MTNAAGLKKKSKCEDALQPFNICINEVVITKVFEVLIINYMPKQQSLVMEEAKVESNVKTCKSELFTYVMSPILFGKMRKQNRTVWKRGIGLDISNMNRKLITYVFHACPCSKEPV